MKKNILMASSAFILAIVGFIVVKGNKKAGICQAFVRGLNFTIVDATCSHFTTLNNGGSLQPAIFRTLVAGGHSYTLVTSSSSSNKVYFKP